MAKIYLKKMQEFKKFSKKQMKVFTWWVEGSGTENMDAVICDGAVRSGKTMCMSISFITWAMSCFDEASFAVCGKTIASVRRNIIDCTMPAMREIGFECNEILSRNLIEISALGHRNRFYIFGGRDESSASLIQGMTLSGIMLDEAALMPRSFVEQAIARCSVAGSKLWFNCNPDHPRHWFREEWILKAEEKNALYLHFTMSDNPSLSHRMIERYERLYTGVFRDRYVLGKWVAAAGAVYPMFNEQIHIKEPPGMCTRYFVSCDYGTVNPCSFGLWGFSGGKWYRLKEYYYDSAVTGERRTDSEHYRELCRLAAGLPVEAVAVDPSAASFIELIRREGEFAVVPAVNDVIDGVRRVQDMLKNEQLYFAPCCKDTIREFGLYRWNEKGTGDSVIKENDHAMDDVRYFVSTFVNADYSDGFRVFSVKR